MDSSTGKNIIEVQKNYSEEIIQEIQHAIDSGNSDIKVLTSINELPMIMYMDNAKITLSHKDYYESCLFVDNNDICGKKWKTCSTYTFFCKDWKRLNKNVDIFANNNYIEINFTVKDANFTALLRRVDIELAENSFALMEYGEITYNNAQYTIIKAFSPSINESYSTKSILENNTIPDKIYDNYGSEIIIDSNGKINIESGDEIITNDDNQDLESEELF